MTKRQMRPPLLLLLAVCAALGLPSPARADGHRRALLIGISTYDRYNKSGLFANLDCDEDLARIEAALVQTFRFDPAQRQITVLKTPEETTRDAILAAWDRLIQDTQSGDIVYIHYSGHGAQVKDDTSPGGLDDALVPSDYTDDTQKHIPGRLLRQYLGRLRAKGPAQVTLTFDCCHSATVTRGEARKRGMSYAEYTDWYQAHHGASPPQPHSHVPDEAKQGGSEPVVRDLEGSGCVVLSACANDQSAYETKDADGKTLGRFSDCLSRVLSQATPQTTYQQVFDQIEALFRQKYADQTPALDGAPDTLLLGGQAAAPQSSLLVTAGPDGSFKLRAGKLQGMTVGSTFALYRKTATKFMPGKEIAGATITNVGLTDSTLEVQKKTGIGDADLAAARAVETAHDYGPAQLTLDVPSLRRAVPAQAGAILASLRQTRLIDDADAGRIPDVKIVRAGGAGRGGTALQIVRGDTGAPLRTLDETRDLTGQLTDALKSIAQYRYATTVLNKEDPLSGVQIRLRLVPAEVTTDADGYTVWQADKTPSGEAVFHKGDYFTVEAQNPGDTDLFLTVLDIDSDGRIGQAWPKPDYRGRNNILTAGKADTWTKLWNGSDVTSHALFRFSAPDPAELYKAVATDSYVDFRALLTGGHRGASSPFDALLEPAAGAVTRDTADIAAPDEWATATVPFSVVP